jgi:hypothetical protein
MPNPPVVIVDPIHLPPKEPPHHFPLPPNHWDDHWGQHFADGISCREGRSIVRHSGFRQVQPIDCSGMIFKYNAVSRRDGRATVLVNMDGDIVRVNYWAALR